MSVDDDRVTVSKAWLPIMVGGPSDGGLKDQQSEPEMMYPLPVQTRMQNVVRSAPRPFHSVGSAVSAFAVALALATTITACSTATGAGDVTTAKPTGTPTVSAAITATESSTARTVSANTATTGELVAALEAAGVAHADRWAREIMEYRPYDAADPTLQHLQDELAKYNPDPATLAAILSVLEP